jgi:hypothetical protein
VLSEGRFGLFTHALYEYAVGVLLIAAPWVFDYDAGAAKAASIVLGLALIVLAGSTDWRLAVVRSTPLGAHALLDFLLAAAAIASPFLFGFSDEAAPTIVLIALGVLHVLMALGTRFRRRDR